MALGVVLQAVRTVPAARVGVPTIASPDRLLKRGSVPSLRGSADRHARMGWPAYYCSDCSAMERPALIPSGSGGGRPLAVGSLRECQTRQVTDE